ncbi:MAG: C40 family peptidase [Chloroflexota bacterium]|nr:C40 family peptidase [Chloroflexota bacterium]
MPRLSRDARQARRHVGCRHGCAHIVPALFAILLALPLNGLLGPVVRAQPVMAPGDIAVVATTEGDHLALREGPGFDFAILATFPAGVEVTVLGGPETGPDGAQWYEVAGAGLTGWSWAEFLLPAAEDVLRIGGTDSEGARLREGPGLEEAILVVIPEGAPVVLLGPAYWGDGYEWSLIRYDLYEGWVASVFLGGASASDWTGAADAPDGSAPVGAAGARASAAGELAHGDLAAVVNTEGLDLRIRDGIGRDAPIHDYAPAGAVLLVVNGPRPDATGGLWYGIDFDGSQGWVLGDYLAPAGASPLPTMAAAAAAPGGATITGADQGPAIVNAALLHLGAPYVWGGATPAGWDCSGMIQYILKQVTGVTLPRTSQQQYLVGRDVAPAEIRAGDLVFFANTAGPGITHNGIALGDGRFIHARSESHGTVITSLADPYWSRHYAGARRP